MKKLDTIQTKQKLNDVYTYDDKGPGGANHQYGVYKHEAITIESTPIAVINFQKGARLEENSITGVIDSDLLEMVRHRLQCFQAGPYTSEYNEKALYHIEQALQALNQRVEDRITRDVLGKNEK